ncbi:MAG: tRNA (adenosine(37)-N6)-threonylcarbamoyltransferase complex ATPase subunit type 1 TsaE [Candidatus Vogelbacteria bacterium CG22_combo_CG10-13_8_21_14_all_37_9]|uniref:tRNA threonylcarbamoyladenosine biosynthesis protein TsaE n=1 Tax=Candidatus Vogelbacteria bacterium CG22_combo_CG10-13_8_21_14_all_37_9 TaxID=1975046 RepID=A0A2H0BK52_9BACT|nr:MAG: tRNA (adenosine(37)-N6)-threonylcarbamoyltransferase complex ATPase subunit type 1 TsaE [bacterium CG10_37_50]PIP58056.1 MAG: tRNA (adenosine(37)-N6)-threonylcarbamoyltransferase complex ATPase subunit type 1 TsaE [Candidatus Vogelbacteria bacterium CG22_combo_CG10-13_8_21_14_all_37_9]
MIVLAKNLSETEKLARRVALELRVGREATILALSGDLGSGKTTFVKALAKALGVRGVATSPTFVLLKKYHLAPSKTTQTGFHQLIHGDFYRLQDSRDLAPLKWAELVLEPKNLIVIEWPEQVGGVGKKAKAIFFKHLSENEREIKIPWLKENSLKN